jgi:hypothetical protein
VGSSVGTVHEDAARAGVQDRTPAEVLGQDGKRYPARRPTIVAAKDERQAEKAQRALRCALCGASLGRRRSDARYCSSACRVESWRLRRLLEGRPVGRYATAADRMAAYGRPVAVGVHKRRERV